MQDQPTPEGDEPRDSAGVPDEDAMVERAVLALVLSFHPATLTIYELARELSKGPEDDAVERAVRDLVGAGLLRCDGPFAVPTDVALYLSRLGVAPTVAPTSTEEQSSNGE